MESSHGGKQEGRHGTESGERYSSGLGHTSFRGQHRGGSVDVSDGSSVWTAKSSNNIGARLSNSFKRSRKGSSAPSWFQILAVVTLLVLIGSSYLLLKKHDQRSEGGQATGAQANQSATEGTSNSKATTEEVTAGDPVSRVAKEQKEGVGDTTEENADDDRPQEYGGNKTDVGKDKIATGAEREVTQGEGIGHLANRTEEKATAKEGEAGEKDSGVWQDGEAEEKDKGNRQKGQTEDKDDGNLQGEVEEKDEGNRQMGQTEEKDDGKLHGEVEEKADDNGQKEQEEKDDGNQQEGGAEEKDEGNGQKGQTDEKEDDLLQEGEAEEKDEVSEEVGQPEKEADGHGQKKQEGKEQVARSRNVQQAPKAQESTFAEDFRKAFERQHSLMAGLAGEGKDETETGREGEGQVAKAGGASPDRGLIKLPAGGGGGTSAGMGGSGATEIADKGSVRKAPEPRLYRPLKEHTMSDEELFRKALSMPLQVPQRPKIAFMFLTRGPLPLAPYWARFFEGRRSKYSIYIHTHPSYRYAPNELPEMFRDRAVPSQEVRWGDPSMVSAERRLYGNALLDRRNMYFVLLSESCIPLFSFKYTFKYVRQSERSFVAVSKDPREHITWGPHMLPEVRKDQWVKGSEWKELHREAALIVIGDTKYFQKFANHCRPPCNPFINGYIDERYVQTLLTLKAPHMIANRTLMWADWKRNFKWAHPHTYYANETTLETLSELRSLKTYTSFSLGGVQHPCTINGVGRYPCYLFARKFDAETVKPLLGLADVLLQE